MQASVHVQNRPIYQVTDDVYVSLFSYPCVTSYGGSQRFYDSLILLSSLVLHTYMQEASKSKQKSDVSFTSQYRACISSIQPSLRSTAFLSMIHVLGRTERLVLYGLGYLFGSRLFSAGSLRHVDVASELRLQSMY